MITCLGATPVNALTVEATRKYLISTTNNEIANITFDSVEKKGKVKTKKDVYQNHS